MHTLHGTNLRLHMGTHIILKLQLGTVLRWCASIDPPSQVHFVSLFLKNADVHDADGNGDCCHVRLHHIASKRYVEIQSGQHIDWPMWPGAISGPMLTTRGGAISFDYAVGIRIESSELTCLGSSGATFDHAQNVTVDQSYFHALSGAAVQFGKFNGPNASLAPGPDTPGNQLVLGNTVSNSVIVDVGVELHGSAGISIGYTAGTNIINNTIANVPASGISIG